MDELIKRQDVIDVMTMVYRYETDRLTAVQELPTVDIGKMLDKIVERLEELVSCYESRAVECDEVGKSELMCIYEAKVAAYRNAIRIAKSGGIIEEKKTEWKNHYARRFERIE